MRLECRELREKKLERHQKRLQRLKSSQNGSSEGGRRRRNNDRNDDYNPSPVTRYDDYGPRYVDSNPYSTLPAPPVGYDDRR